MGGLVRLVHGPLEILGENSANQEQIIVNTVQIQPLSTKACDDTWSTPPAFDNRSSYRQRIA